MAMSSSSDIVPPPVNKEDEKKHNKNNLFLVEPLASLEVGDSRFLGFAFKTDITSDNHVGNVVDSIKSRLKKSYPGAAHVPICWIELDNVEDGTQAEEKQQQLKEGYNEDNEPNQSVGPYILQELKTFVMAAKPTVLGTSQQTKKAVVILAIVRFFEKKLLGVTCGRLSQVYASISKLSMHRYIHGIETPFLTYPTSLQSLNSNLYGLGAGDTEVILNVIPKEMDKEEIMRKIKQELTFDGFVGSKGETLPRLQNLQGNITDHEKVIPVYRYPGNYSGDEWPTHSWSTTSLYIKEQVETALQPLVNQQMNHCVTNWYRNNADFIAHHSDKDLDLLENSVIVSVSLGSERILELKRKKEPRDVTRLKLPHGSMLVLGWKTNREFTHSILQEEEGKEEGGKVSRNGERISLTMRTCATFLDLQTNRLFGKGIKGVSTLEFVRAKKRRENLWDFTASSSIMLFARRFVFGTPLLLLQGDKKDGGPKSANKQQQRNDRVFNNFAIAVGIFVSSWVSMKYVRDIMYRQKEEREARNFFSKHSTSGTKY